MLGSCQSLFCSDNHTGFLYSMVSMILFQRQKTAARFLSPAALAIVVAVSFFGIAVPRADAGIMSFLKRHLSGKPHHKDTADKNHSKNNSSAKTGRQFTANTSWYGGKFQGRRTASGETFDQNKLTAASRTLPLGSRLTVQNPATGKTCTVTINDRGPFVAGRDLDLSRAAAQSIGLTGVSPLVCTIDSSTVGNYGQTTNGRSLKHVPGKILHLLGGIL
jgi:3D (Asp-Asp-Asp) domain-containing protein